MKKPATRKRRAPAVGLRHRLVMCLADAPGRVIPKETLRLAAYEDHDGPEGEDNVLAVTVCKINKLHRPVHGDVIENEWGVGYRMTPAFAALVKERGAEPRPDRGGK